MKRTIFAPSAIAPYYTEIIVDIDSEFSFEKSSLGNNIRLVHEEFRKMYPDLPKPLEISTATYQKPQGMWLSAYRIKKNADGNSYPFESVYQGSKVFENGGPYRAIFRDLPANAKRNPSLRNSGKLTGYEFKEGEITIKASKEQREAFYNYLYNH